MGRKVSQSTPLEWTEGIFSYLEQKTLFFDRLVLHCLKKEGTVYKRWSCPCA
jgi:hypothetical protein